MASIIDFIVKYIVKYIHFLYITFQWSITNKKYLLDFYFFTCTKRIKHRIMHCIIIQCALF